MAGRSHRNRVRAWLLASGLLASIAGTVALLVWSLGRPATADAAGRDSADAARGSDEVAAAAPLDAAVAGATGERDANALDSGARGDVAAVTRTSLGDEEVELSGWFIVRTRLDPRPREDGRLVLAGRSRARGELRLELPVVAGRFGTTVPGDAQLDVVTAELGGLPTSCAPAHVDVSRDHLLEIQASWARPITLHVVDSRTGAELHGVRLAETDAELAFAPPADSPVTLPVPWRPRGTRVEFRSSTTMRVTAERCAAASITLDFEKGGDVAVELTRPAALRVIVEAAGRSPLSDLPKLCVRVRRLLGSDHRPADEHGVEMWPSFEEMLARHDLSLLPAGSRKEFEVAILAECASGSAVVEFDGERMTGVGSDGITRFDDLLAGEWLVTAEAREESNPSTVIVNGRIIGAGYILLDARSTSVLGAARVTTVEDECVDCRLLLGSRHSDSDEEVELRFREHGTSMPDLAERISVSASSSFGPDAEPTVLPLDPTSGTARLPRRLGRFVEVLLEPRGPPWIAPRRFAIDLDAAPSQLTLPVDPATGLLLYLTYGGVSFFRSASMRVALIDDAGSAARESSISFRKGDGADACATLFVVPHPGRWQLVFPEDGTFGERAPLSVDLVGGAVAETTIALDR